MKLSTFVRKTTTIPKNISYYLQTRRKWKLYQQWIEQADLPPESIPEKGITEERVPRIDRKRFRVYILFMALGAALIIVCGGLILLVVYAC